MVDWVLPFVQLRFCWVLSQILDIPLASKIAIHMENTILDCQDSLSSGPGKKIPSSVETERHLIPTAMSTSVVDLFPRWGLLFHSTCNDTFVSYGMST